MLSRTADKLVLDIHASPFGLYLNEINLPERTKYKTIKTLEEEGLAERVDLRPFLKNTRLILTMKGKVYAVIMLGGDQIE